MVKKIFICIILLIAINSCMYKKESSEKQMSASIVEMDTKTTNVLYPLEINGLYGFINQFGKLVVEPQFKYYGYKSTCGIAVGSDPETEYYLDDQGRILFTLGKGMSGRRFSDDMLAVCLETTEGFLWGYMDKSGKWNIAPQYKNAEDFSEGLANVSYGGIFDRFYIDKKNQPVFGEKKYWGNYFKNGYAYVWKKIKDNFKIIRNEYGVEFFEEISGTFGGIIDKNGEIIIPFVLDANTVFSDGLFCTRYKNIHHEILQKTIPFVYIDTNNIVILETNFELAYQFVDGVAVASPDSENYGLINKKGEFVVEPIYKDLRTMEEGLILFSIDREKYGFMNKYGTIIIQAEFDFANSFDGPLAFIHKGDSTGYVTKNGKVFLATDY